VTDHGLQPSRREVAGGGGFGFRATAAGTLFTASASIVAIAAGTLFAVAASASIVAASTSVITVAASASVVAVTAGAFLAVAAGAFLAVAAGAFFAVAARRTVVAIAGAAWRGNEGLLLFLGLPSDDLDRVSAAHSAGGTTEVV
jgi:hypothetical protein